MNEFELDERLYKDTVKLTRWPLCEVLLMNAEPFPWVILVPRKPGIREIFELSEQEQVQLLRESSVLGQELMRLFSGDKLNVAALGNVVSQLHVHHVVRFKSDICWPAPVWGNFSAQPYSAEALEARIKQLNVLSERVWD